MNYQHYSNYGIRSNVSVPETAARLVALDDVTQVARIRRNVLRSDRPAGKYFIVRWTDGTPWNVTTVATFTKH